MKKMIYLIGICVGIVLINGCEAKEKADTSSNASSIETTSSLETDSYETIAGSDLEETEVAKVKTSEEDEEAILEVVSDDDFRWDKEYLAENYLKELDDDELRILRNEFYARHGCSFVSDDLQAYFSAQSWYHPLSDTMATTFDSSLFNNYEKENLILIEKVEIVREQGSVATDMMEDDELTAVVNEFINEGYTAEYGDSGLYIRDANGMTVATYDYWSEEWYLSENATAKPDQSVNFPPTVKSVGNYYNQYFGATLEYDENKAYIVFGTKRKIWYDNNTGLWYADIDDLVAGITQLMYFTGVSNDGINFKYTVVKNSKWANYNYRMDTFSGMWTTN